MRHTSPCREEEYQVEPEKTPRERAEDLMRLLVPDWRPTPGQWLWAIRIGIVLGILVAIGYSYGVTLWDWIKLLIVPAVIAGGGLWFNRQQRERELEIAEHRTQDEGLQAYLDVMSQLLTDEKRPLRRAQIGDSLSSVARARTVTVLPRLDGERKARVVQFLYESGLIAKRRPVLNLHGADVTEAALILAELRRANLRGANLRGADLESAKFCKTIMPDGTVNNRDCPPEPAPPDPSETTPVPD
jgi:hypothetical protein